MKYAGPSSAFESQWPILRSVEYFIAAIGVIHSWEWTVQSSGTKTGVHVTIKVHQVMNKVSRNIGISANDDGEMKDWSLQVGELYRYDDYDPAGNTLSWHSHGSRHPK